MSPAIAAARNVGPPIVCGNVSIEGAGAFIAVAFAGAGGGKVEGIGRAGSEPVESALGHCDRGAAGAGAGVTLGAALEPELGLALGPAFGAAGGGVRLNGGAVMGCAAGASVAAGSTFCLPPALSPGAVLGTALGTALGSTSGATLDAVFGAALGTGATSGVGPIVAAGDGSALPKGCVDPLCGGAAFGVFCGGAVGCDGLCHCTGESRAGRLSRKKYNAIDTGLTTKSVMAPATKI